MAVGTVAVLCDHDLLCVGLRCVLEPAWDVRRVTLQGLDLAGAVVLVVDTDEPRHAEVLVEASGVAVVAWTWHAVEGAGTTPSVAATLPKQADREQMLALLDELGSGVPVAG